MPSGAQPLTPLELAGLAGFWTVVILAGLAARQLAPVRSRSRITIPGAESVRIPTTDGLWLAGWRIADRPAAPWILIYLGIDQSLHELTSLVQALRAASFNLLLLLPRAYRPSQGSATSLGGQEQHDLEGALAYLSRQPDVLEGPLGIVAISTSALPAILLAARDERLGVVALDSAAGDPLTAFSDRLVHAYKLPRIAAWPVAWAIYRIRFGRSPDRAQIRRAIAAMPERPILLLHGSADHRVRADRLSSLFPNANAQTSIVTGADHRTMPRTSNEYGEHIAQFFSAYLQASPTTTAPRAPSSI